MAVRDYNTSASLNTDISGINIGEGAPAANVNDAIRQLMADQAAFIRPTVSVIEYGAIGNNIANDTAAISAAYATGKHVEFPEGYTFLTDGGHTPATGQVTFVRGTVKKRSGSSSSTSVFVVNDAVDRVTFTGGGVIDGNRSAFAADSGVSGIIAYRATNLVVDNLTIQECIDCGIKAINCPNLTVTDTMRFYKISNVGVEIKTYANDPRAVPPLSAPWSGAAPESPSGQLGGSYDWIDDGKHGAGNGCGIDFSTGEATAPPIRNLRITGRFKDCLRAIWSENNFTANRAYNITIVSPVIIGNVRGAGTVETKDGIGIGGVVGCRIIAPEIRNVGNITPPSGSICAGIHVTADSANVRIIAPYVVDDTGAGVRTDYCIYLNDVDDITISGGDISGGSDGQLFIQTDPLKGTVTNLRTFDLRGEADEYTWADGIVPYRFQMTDIAASITNSAMLSEGYAGMDDLPMIAAGRIVGFAVRLSAGIGAGNISFNVFGNNVEQTSLAINQTSIGTGGVRATKRQTAAAATQLSADHNIKVLVTTNGSWAPTTADAVATVYVDHGMKK